MNIALLAKIVMFILSAASFIVFGLSKVRKYYILYLGFGFCSLGISLFFTNSTPVFRIIALLLTLYSFTISTIEGIKETRERLAKFRNEQNDREIAFAKFQSALIEEEKNKTEAKAVSGERESGQV